MVHKDDVGRRKLATAIALIISGGLAATAANAQIEEIVVTAQKREQNINDVGMTIQALSGEQLTDRNLVSLEEISAAVPGLIFSPSTTNTPIFTLRGVGFNESSLGVYPSTSLYIDEAPLSFPTLAMHTAYDLERVEVLKGPQGTLFGQNSTAGAINFIAAKPTDEFKAGVDVSYGRFNRIEWNGFVSGPISDNLRGRIAVTGVDAGAWQKSSTRDAENGKEKYYAGRVLLDWDASDSVSFKLNVNGWQDKSEPQAMQLTTVRINPDTAAFTTAWETGQPLSPLGPRAADWSDANSPQQTLTSPAYVNFVLPTLNAVGITNLTPIEAYEGLEPQSNRKFIQTSLRMDAKLGESTVLTILGTYQDFDQDLVTDGDGGYYVQFDLQKIAGKVKSKYVEARLSGNPNDNIEWVVGASYDKSDTFEDQLLRYFDNSSYGANMGINVSGVTLDQAIETKAVFANVEYKFAERFTVKAGARYTDTSNKAENCGYSTPNGRVNYLFNFLDAAFDGVVPGNTPARALNDVDYPCYTLNDFLDAGTPFRDTLSEDNVSWRAGLDYAVSDDILTYLTVSKGYKAGSFPALAAASFPAVRAVTQESNQSYEVGMKARLAGGIAQVNGAFFYYDYKDKQVRGKIPDPVGIFGILDGLVNIPKSEIYGFDADLTVRPDEHWSFNAGFTLIKSKIKTYNGYDIYGAQRDFGASSTRLPFTPKFAWNVGGQYAMPVGGGEAFLGANVRGQSESDAALGASQIPFDFPNAVSKTLTNYPYVIDSFAVLDLNAGWRSEDDRWRVVFWGKNVTNKYYWTSVIPSSNGASRFAGRPATYGVTVGFKF